MNFNKNKNQDNKLKKLLILLIFYFAFSIKVQGEVIIVRDVPESPAINDIINNIVSSIESFLPESLYVYTNKEFKDISHKKDVIVIGNESISKLDDFRIEFNRKIHVGSMLPSENAYTFGFTPSPRDVVDKIKNYFPSKKKVYIVSNKRHEWLDKHYEKYFQENNIKVTFYYANSLRDATEHYKNILTKINNESGLILLNENSMVDEDAILPYILNKSWDEDIAILSTKSSHAKYGILMSFVPDIKNFGKQVNECFVNNCNSIDNIDGFNITKQLVNKRMYKHLELDFNDEVIFLE